MGESVISVMSDSESLPYTRTEVVHEMLNPENESQEIKVIGRSREKRRREKS